MEYSSDDKQRFETYVKVHLRSKADLPDNEKIPELRKRLNTKWIQLAINVAIIVVFGYMYLRGYTTFGDTFYYVIFGLFLLNMGLITLQRRQILELIRYFEHKLETG
jgi:hypothetical protein